MEENPHSIHPLLSPLPSFNSLAQARNRSKSVQHINSDQYGAQSSGNSHKNKASPFYNHLPGHYDMTQDHGQHSATIHSHLGFSMSSSANQSLNTGLENQDSTEILSQNFNSSLMEASIDHQQLQNAAHQMVQSQSSQRLQQFHSLSSSVQEQPSSQPQLFHDHTRLPQSNPFQPSTSTLYNSFSPSSEQDIACLPFSPASMTTDLFDSMQDSLSSHQLQLTVSQVESLLSDAETHHHHHDLASNNDRQQNLSESNNAPPSISQSSVLPSFQSMSKEILSPPKTSQTHSHTMVELSGTPSCNSHMQSLPSSSIPSTVNHVLSEALPSFNSFSHHETDGNQMFTGSTVKNAVSKPGSQIPNYVGYSHLMHQLVKPVPQQDNSINARESSNNISFRATNEMYPSFVERVNKGNSSESINQTADVYSASSTVIPDKSGITSVSFAHNNMSVVSHTNLSVPSNIVSSSQYYSKESSFKAQPHNVLQSQQAHYSQQNHSLGYGTVDLTSFPSTQSLSVKTSNSIDSNFILPMFEESTSKSEQKNRILEIIAQEKEKEAQITKTTNTEVKKVKKKKKARPGNSVHNPNDTLALSHLLSPPFSEQINPSHPPSKPVPTFQSPSNEFWYHHHNQPNRNSSNVSSLPSHPLKYVSHNEIHPHNTNLQEGYAYTDRRKYNMEHVNVNKAQLPYRATVNDSNNNAQQLFSPSSQSQVGVSNQMHNSSHTNNALPPVHMVNLEHDYFRTGMPYQNHYHHNNMGNSNLSHHHHQAFDEQKVFMNNSHYSGQQPQNMKLPVRQPPLQFPTNPTSVTSVSNSHQSPDVACSTNSISPATNPGIMKDHRGLTAINPEASGPVGFMQGGKSAQNQLFTNNLIGCPSQSQQYQHQQSIMNENVSPSDNSRSDTSAYLPSQLPSPSSELPSVPKSTAHRHQQQKSLKRFGSKDTKVSHKPDFIGEKNSPQISSPPPFEHNYNKLPSSFPKHSNSCASINSNRAKSPIVTNSNINNSNSNTSGLLKRKRGRPPKHLSLNSTFKPPPPLPFYKKKKKIPLNTSSAYTKSSLQDDNGSRINSHTHIHQSTPLVKASPKVLYKVNGVDTSADAGHIKFNNSSLVDRLVNNQMEMPSCSCLGEINVPSESIEGPYYTQLGAAKDIVGIRKIMEQRTGISGSAIRIEKVVYTGKEGKSRQGCPVAKWIIRRSGQEEKYLCIVRQRPGHFCNTAVLIVTIVAWEGVATDQANLLYDSLTGALPKHGLETDRRCGLNEKKTCACQGVDLLRRGASFSFGCSWSMYYNGCKFARSLSARKFKLNDSTVENELEDKLQTLATDVAPLYKTLAPEAFRNQTQFEDHADDCRLGNKPGRPFSGVTAVVDFCCHSHKDIHNMNNGCTVLVNLTKHRGLGKPDDEQFHVLPLYVLDQTDEFGSAEAQMRKVNNGSLEILSHYLSNVRTRSTPYYPGKRNRTQCKNKQGALKKSFMKKRKLENLSKSQSQDVKDEGDIKSNIQTLGVKDSVTDLPISSISQAQDSKSMNQQSAHNADEALRGNDLSHHLDNGMTQEGSPDLYSKFWDYFYANGTFPPQEWITKNKETSLSSLSSHPLSQTPTNVNNSTCQFPHTSTTTTSKHNSILQPSTFEQTKSLHLHPQEQQQQQCKAQQQTVQRQHEESGFIFNHHHHHPSQQKRQQQQQQNGSSSSSLSSYPPAMNDEYQFSPNHCITTPPSHHHQLSEAVDIKCNNNMQSLVNSHNHSSSSSSSPSFVPMHVPGSKDPVNLNPSVSIDNQNANSLLINQQTSSHQASEFKSTNDILSHGVFSEFKTPLPPDQIDDDSNQISYSSKLTPNFNQSSKENISYIQSAIKIEPNSENLPFNPLPSGTELTSIDKKIYPAGPVAGEKVKVHKSEGLVVPIHGQGSHEPPYQVIDTTVVSEELDDNVGVFTDPSVGGIALALCHGAVLFEVAKRELHATTALKHPNRYQPNRISLVFYQHKNLNLPRHGYEENERKTVERKNLLKQTRMMEEMESKGFLGKDLGDIASNPELLKGSFGNVFDFKKSKETLFHLQFPRYLDGSLVDHMTPVMFGCMSIAFPKYMKEAFPDPTQVPRLMAKPLPIRMDSSSSDAFLKSDDISKSDKSDDKELDLILKNVGRSVSSESAQSWDPNRVQNVSLTTTSIVSRWVHGVANVTGPYNSWIELSSESNEELESSQVDNADDTGRTIQNVVSDTADVKNKVPYHVPIHRKSIQQQYKNQDTIKDSVKQEVESIDTTLKDNVKQEIESMESSKNSVIQHDVGVSFSVEEEERGAVGNSEDLSREENECLSILNEPVKEENGYFNIYDKPVERENNFLPSSNNLFQHESLDVLENAVQQDSQASKNLAKEENENWDNLNDLVQKEKEISDIFRNSVNQENDIADVLQNNISLQKEINVDDVSKHVQENYSQNQKVCL